MASHLEDLIAEYYDWQGYLVKRNVKVGRLGHGGWEMELDVVAYDPHEHHLVHVEASIDAHAWETRARRFAKKFGSGLKYVFKEVFTWLDEKTPVEQIALLVSHPKERDWLAGGKIVSIDEFIEMVRTKVKKCGPASRNAIPEQYPLLRMMQLSHNGYFRAKDKDA